MMAEKMNSMQRVLTTLGHNEPDRVPLFLLLSLHGAKELNLSIKDYFSVPEQVFEGQMRLLNKYYNDCLFGFYHAPLEFKAWGGEVIFNPAGPPNSGLPVLRHEADIRNLQVPDVHDSPVLAPVLRTLEMMKREVADTVPIIGVAISPFSLPVMQMGFDRYLELIYDNPTLFWYLMEQNITFCVNWANAQLEAGATAICYFDPVSSPTIIPKDLYMKTGYTIAVDTLKQIKGPTATHLASGRSLPIANELATTGTAIIGVSAEESMKELKEAYKNKLTIIGNLNGIAMRNWSPSDTRRHVLQAIREGARGGGFILSDNHGEIPWQVPEEVLMTISETVREFGTYPIQL